MYTKCYHERRHSSLRPLGIALLALFFSLPLTSRAQDTADLKVDLNVTETVTTYNSVPAVKYDFVATLTNDGPDEAPNPIAEALFPPEVNPFAVPPDPCLPLNVQINPFAIPPTPSITFSAFPPNISDAAATVSFQAALPPTPSKAVIDLSAIPAFSSVTATFTLVHSAACNTSLTYEVRAFHDENSTPPVASQKHGNACADPSQIICDDTSNNTATYVYNPTASLPVELVAFGAQQDGGAVRLHWETASETNNAGFEVQQRSGTATGGNTAWDVRGFVAGAGTTLEAQDYSYLLEGVAPGRHTFRLKQVDFDGAFTYSPEIEVAVEVPGTHALSPVYPNPFNPEAGFTLALAQAQTVRVAVYDALGREVRLLHEGAMEADYAYRFRLAGSGLPSGLYLVRAIGEHFAATQRALLLK